ncbi:MAG: hypothetical protein MJA83_08250 [Gammaproteobacteria bacterium]|nr:hypothetical protein [Gammaproteobacteria bacterium]
MTRKKQILFANLTAVFLTLGPVSVNADATGIGNPDPGSQSTGAGAMSEHENTAHDSAKPDFWAALLAGLGKQRAKQQR